MVTTAGKQIYGNRRSKKGRLAKTLGVSFYPEHFDILSQRAKELNIGRSILLQLLVEVEHRDGIARPELIARLSAPILIKKTDTVTKHT